VAGRREYTPRAVTSRTARAVVAAAVALSTAGAAGSARDAFAVGVLRRDGVILPFAVFDGKKWSSPWPGPTGDLTVPIDLRAVPKGWWGVGAPLEMWQIAPGDGAGAARIVQPDWVNIHCARYVGLRSDYQPPQPAPPRTTQPYPKDGLAVSPPHAIDRVEILPPASPELRALLPAVHTAFNDAERDVESQYGHPISRRAREGIAPTVEAVYAYGDSPRVYYVEALRPYRQLGQQVGDCSAVGSGTGWFVRSGGEVRLLTMVVDILNCDRQSASYMLPLGVVRLNDRLFWLAQFSGWDHERYVVLEVKKKSVDVVVNRWGGSC
jgi:hypothetical protein